MAESERFMREVSSALLASADPSARMRIATRLRQSMQKEISGQYGHVLAMAPTVHFLPLYPKRAKEPDMEKVVNEAIGWLREQPGMVGAYLYELKDRQKEAGRVSAREASVPPPYVLILICGGKDVLPRLRKHKDGTRLQAQLAELCEGFSATDEGEYGINTMLIGLE